MRNPVAAILAAAALIMLGGCESSEPQPNGMREVFDAEHHRVWTLTAEGVVVRGRPGSRSATIELRDWFWLDSMYACPPGLAIGPRGEAVITSNAAPVVWLVDPDTLAVTVHELALGSDADADFGFSAIVYAPQSGGYIAASDVHRSVWRIDLELKTATRVMRRDIDGPRACTQLLSGVVLPGE